MALSKRVKLVVTVPESHADAVREALGKAGAGKIGNYSFCTFSLKGVGRFRPEESASPFLGTPGHDETVTEERIETVCSENQLDKVLSALRQAHPYEEPAIDLYPLYEF